MTNPMTAEEVRDVADGIFALGETGWGLNTPKGRIDLRELVKSLRAYADTLDRQTVDREKVARHIHAAAIASDETILKYIPWAALTDDQKGFWLEATDRILALMPAAPVAAKELEWRGDNAANTPFGLYWVVPVSPRNPDGEWLFTAPITATTDMYPTREAAKAAAQAHYNDAISKAVRPAPVTDGMVMVPREPTEAVAYAGFKSVERVFREGLEPNPDDWKDAYRAMIEAAKGGE